MLCGRWEEYPREFAKCRRCRKAKYCGKECQSTAWNEGHRFWCSAKERDDENEENIPAATELSHERDRHGDGRHGRSRNDAPTVVAASSTGTIRTRQQAVGRDRDTERDRSLAHSFDPGRVRIPGDGPEDQQRRGFATVSHTENVFRTGGSGSLMRE